MIISIFGDDPSTGWVLIDSLPSNLTSYTDVTPPSIDSRYMIEIRPPSPCNTTLRVNGHNEIQTTVVKSKSNIKNNRTTGIKDSKIKDATLHVYPNPATDVLNVEFVLESGVEATMTIENMLGQVVYAVNTNKTKNTINTTEFKTGVYFVKVKTNKGTSIEKLIIE